MVLLLVETKVRQSCMVGGEDDGGDMNSRLEFYSKNDGANEH